MASIRKLSYSKLHLVLHIAHKVIGVLGRFRPFEMLVDFVLSKLFPDTGIPFVESARSTGSMEKDWDNRAKLNALVATSGETNDAVAEASASRSLERYILKGIG